MKRVNVLFVTILLIFSCLPIAAYSSYGWTNRNSYSISFDYPVFYRQKWKTYREISLYRLNFEKNWESRRYNKTNYSFAVNYGKYFYEIGTGDLYGIEFSAIMGKGRHFLEMGAGIDNKLMSYAILGYRLQIGSSITFKLRILPSTWLLDEYNNSSDKSVNFIDLGLSIGYRIPQKTSNNIENAFLHSFQSIHLMIYPFSYDEPKKYGLTETVGVSFLLYKINKHHFLIYGEFGFISGETPIYPIGIGYLLGAKKNFFETRVNVFSASLINPNYDWKIDSYKIFQTQVGYRYNFIFPMFLRIAYAPYIRTLDWKREGGLHHNMVLGVGYRFGK